MVLTLTYDDSTATTRPIHPTSATTTSQRATNVKVAIMFRGQDVTARRSPDVLIGEKIDPTLEIGAPPGWLPPADGYTWSIPGPTFKDYIATTELGKVIDLGPDDVKHQSVAFYWSDATTTGVERMVYVATTINGVIYQRYTRFKVYEPVSEFSVDVGVTRMGRSLPNIPHQTFGLQPPPGSQNPGGMRFTGDVALDPVFGAVAGQWYVTQLITSHMYGLIGGMLHVRRHNGEPRLLDSGVRYKSDTDGRYVFATGSGPQVIPDTPYVGLERAGLTWAQRDDVFDTYLMFVPPGADSRPVPLRKTAVSWGGAVYRNPNPTDPNFSDVWLQDFNHPWYQSNDMSGTEVWQHPEWTKSADPSWVPA